MTPQRGKRGRGGEEERKREGEGERRRGGEKERGRGGEEERRRGKEEAGGTGLGRGGGLDDAEVLFIGIDAKHSKSHNLRLGWGWEGRVVSV